MVKKIDTIRTNYNLSKLTRGSLNCSPIMQFKEWFMQLKHVNDFNAMTLSTYSNTKGVQNRVVLLKEVNKDGFIFYTNYNSLKGNQIRDNNNVALCFFWPSLQRQVRVNGIAVKLSQLQSKKYFDKRPRKSQIATWACGQSEVISGRDNMDSKFSSLELKFKNKKIPKPSFWGGYQVVPVSVEFWQGRENRMHDRFLYEKKDDKWIISRLAP